MSAAGTRANYPRFLGLLSRSAVGPVEPEAVWEDLASRYGEPHRHYHTLAHIDAMLAHFDGLPDPADTLEWAVWYHDCIYRPASTDNEALSADHFARVLGSSLDPRQIAAVEDLIRATDHTRPGPRVGLVATMCDLDLAILGADPGDYDDYRLAIRREYAFVPDPDFRRGRRRVLLDFLAGPVYSTGAFSHLESQARENLGRELEDLD